MNIFFVKKGEVFNKKTPDEIKWQAGFTLIELIVTIALFVFMTSFLLIKYSTFHSGVLTTNLAYDVAITIRQAQSYGLYVKQSQATANSFASSYGVYFSTASGNADKFILFEDRPTPSNPDNVYVPASDTTISTYRMKNGAKIVSIKATANPSNLNNLTTLNNLSVTYKRPQPRAIIASAGMGGGGTPATYKYAEITISGSDGDTRKIIVRQDGQISVQ